MPFDAEAWNRRALLTCAEMRQAEDATCSRGRVTFYDLMNNAGEALARVVCEKWKPCRVLVMCGPGNNGGDGYVAAEVLRKAGWQVVVGALTAGKHPEDAAKAATTWQGETRPLSVDLLNRADLVIDALFGTGLQRPLEGEVAKVVDALNARDIPVISADLPSGVDGDTGRILGVAVRADVSVTWFRKKVGHVLLPGAQQAGEVIIVDVGMPSDVLEKVKVAENNMELWRRLFPMPQSEWHKYTRGHALVYGGAVMTGAARLAARAAQRIGAGLVTLAAPENAVFIYVAALESILVRSAETPDAWSALVEDGKKNAILIGPGMGHGGNIKEFVHVALASKKACVLDADALTIFASEPEELFKTLHSECILTPHEGEFARLFGKMISPSLDKLERARKAAALAGCTVLLKGADTVVADSSGLAVINTKAPPWLATAGAGDVLSGIILGLMASGMMPFEAAVAAVNIHGSVAEAFGPGLIAEDIVDGIPQVLGRL